VRGLDTKAIDATAILARMALGCRARDGHLGQQGIVGVYDIRQEAHFADAEPSQVGVFVTDVGRIAALPTRDGINGMQCISIDFRLPLLDCRDESEPGWRYPYFFLNFMMPDAIDFFAKEVMPEFSR